MIDKYTVPWWFYWSAIVSWVLYFLFSPLFPQDKWIGVASRAMILAVWIFVLCKPSKRKDKETGTRT